jgi:hypothetical protein
VPNSELGSPSWKAKREAGNRPKPISLGESECSNGLSKWNGQLACIISSWHDIRKQGTDFDFFSTLAFSSKYLSQNQNKENTNAFTMALPPGKLAALRMADNGAGPASGSESPARAESPKYDEQNAASSAGTCS